MPPGAEVVRPRRGGGDSLRPVSAPSADVTLLPSYREAHELGRTEGFSAGVEEGRTAGYAAGLEAARAEAAEQARVREEADEVERRTRDQRFATLSQELDRRLAETLAELRAAAERDEALVVSLAVDLAAELVGRELSVVDEPARHALERALALAPDGVALVARMHPDDADLAHFDRDGLKVVADAQVAPGGCVLEAGDTTFDVQVDDALARVRAVAAELGGGR